MPNYKKNMIALFVLIWILPGIPLYSQSSLPIGKYAFMEKIIQVTGTPASGNAIFIDFPMYSFNSTTGELSYVVDLNLTDGTQVILGGSLSYVPTGAPGGGVSEQLSLYEVLNYVDLYTVALDGSAQYYYNGVWLSLAPGESWTETVAMTAFMGAPGQFTQKTTIKNWGILDKSKISAPNLATAAPSPGPTPAANLCGDVNADTRVDIVDALSIARYFIGLPPSPFYAESADVNGDGSATIVDALLVAQYYVGIRSSLNCP